MATIDLHMHTDSSPDGHFSAEEMCRAAIARGLTHIALTDHWETVDYEKDNYGERGERAYAAAEAAGRQFAGVLSVARGIEIGCPLFDEALTQRQLAAHPYDFVLASQHQLGDQPDFYFLDYSEMDIEKTLDEYFENVFRVAQWGQFDSLAHLTYPFRYIPADRQPGGYGRWEDIIDAIFRTLAQNGKALEINTSGLRKEIGLTQPDLPLIRRFFACGGELVTVGSDAHRTNEVGADIDRGLALAVEAGFRYVTLYSERKPQPVKIG